MRTDELDAALHQLVQEQRLLDSLRQQYLTVRKSRFYGIRALFAAGKHFLLGRSSLVADGVAATTATALNESVILRSPALKLQDGWKWRMAGPNPLRATPIVSVIIPVYNNADVTVRCLQSIVDTWFESIRVQIILADDCSRDRTPIVASSLPGLDYVRNDENSGFIRTCNRAARVARGKYLCFLNNDTAVTDGWLEELLLTAEHDEGVGVVGSKLLYPDGRLQEAGGLIWRDGNGWNYGRLDDPEDPRYNYVREVDYCSGAALLVRTELFNELGGFSETYVPAYFEDSDLCFAARARGYRVMYQPKSVVVHYEGVSSGTSTDSGIKRHQVLNKPKFLEKWQANLQEHLEHDASKGLQAARRLGRGKTLLMIDNYVPEFDKDSGSNKLYNLIREFQNIGYDVIYAPDNYHRSEPYTSVFQRMGVEVLYRTDKHPSLEQPLRERLAIADLVWIGRPEIASKWLPLVRRFPKIPIVYDTHDLHYVRVERELQLLGIQDETRWSQWRRERDQELKVIHSVDVAITVTHVERELLQAGEGVQHAFVVPNVHEIYDRKYRFEDTDGIIFIGGYQHGPNVDGVQWLCSEIMPAVWKVLPDVKLTLLGSNPPDAVKALAGERVAVPGYIHDVAPYFERARVFVAPLRYGAGLKGKIGQAFAYRVPTVTTAIGAEGFGIVNGHDAIVADSPREFADAIVKMYNDSSLWTALSEGGARCVEQYSAANTRLRLKQLISLANSRRSVAMGLGS